jgi:trans-2,3-dihydro-3-hydroxyanthranilate isomerase
MQIQFYFVNVFAERPLTGNPLAVVPHAEVLDDVMMQRIAGELNQAETTFILPPRDKSAHWRLRSFTAPGHEIFGAGHNSLGAWWWMAESKQLTLIDGANHFTQEIGDSLLPVEVRSEGQQPVSVVLTQSPPHFGNICEDVRGLANALGLEIDDLSSSLPAQVVSTGAGTPLGASPKSGSHCPCSPRCSAVGEDTQGRRWARLLPILSRCGRAGIGGPRQVF